MYERYDSMHDIQGACMVWLYKLYQSRPPGRPNGAFYLKPLKKRKADVWFGCSPLGHNVLRNTIRRLFEHAEIPGFYTNHSLRTTAATRLFDAGVDEHLIFHLALFFFICFVFLFLFPSMTTLQVERKR